MSGKSERFEMRLDEELLRQLDHWRGAQSDVPSRAEAVRRLIAYGTKERSGELKPTRLERLNLWMMAEILKSVPGSDTQETAQLVQDAIYGGHFWALDWELTGLMHDHVDQPEVVTDVVNILDMWSFIERAHHALSATEKNKLIDELGAFAKNPKFLGFDGNNEVTHMSVASFLIKKLGRFEYFNGRDFNSHMPTVTLYLTMYREFEGIRPNLVGREMNYDELARVLRRD